MLKHVQVLLLAAAAAALVAVPAADAKKAKSTKSAAAVTVTAGKPSEFGFTLSAKTVKRGTVTFKITNKGAIPHDFSVCSAPTKSDSANSCKGKTSKQMSPGQSATLTVKFAKAGKYEYLCTVPGHAAGGMKGLLTVK